MTRKERVSMVICVEVEQAVQKPKHNQPASLQQQGRVGTCNRRPDAAQGAAR